MQETTTGKSQKFKKGVAINNDIIFAHNTVGPVALLKTDLEFVILGAHGYIL